MDSNDTLPDDAWKDSFDKLLEQRPILRELCVIKRDIRASYNMNSSYENSNFGNSSALRLDKENYESFKVSKYPSSHQYLELPITGEKVLSSHITTANVISTPNRNYFTGKPFQCTLSPIGSWNLLHFKAKNHTKLDNADSKVIIGASMTIDNPVLNLEYTDEKSSSLELLEKQNTHTVEVSPLTHVQHKWKTKQNQKQVCFVSKTTNTENKSEHYTIDVSGLEYSSSSYKFNLPPGKWRKSLNYLRLKHFKEDIKQTRKSDKFDFSNGQDIEDVKNLRSSMARGTVAGQRKSILVKPNSIQTRNESKSTYSLECNDFQRQVLQRCGQRRVLNFESIYSEQYLKDSRKIGEGAFGEVFLHSSENNIQQNKKINKDTMEKTVLKVIPIGGKELVNGEMQKSFEQILPEVIISMELCSLSSEKRVMNATNGFVSLKRVRCVKGKYPAYLLKLWDEYDLEHESENDHPKCFSNIQKFIILEMAFSGQDLETYQFRNAEQSFSALRQIILTLAVGESEYQFEHRDLHWGNVLVLSTNKPNISYKIGGKTLTLPSKGVKITIIDYTLSRMTFNNYCFYNDLSTDEELFIATGDYQFEIYRMMRKVLKYVYIKLLQIVSRNAKLRN